MTSANMTRLTNYDHTDHRQATPDPRREASRNRRRDRRVEPAPLLARPAIDKNRVLGDVAYLQTALGNWTDDGTHFGKITKQLIEAAIAEAATDKRLTNTA